MAAAAAAPFLNPIPSVCECVFVAVAHFKCSLLNFVITKAQNKQSQQCVEQWKGGEKQGESVGRAGSEGGSDRKRDSAHRAS